MIRTVDAETFQKMQTYVQWITMGMSNEDNKCWPTVKRWTKKERDEAIANAGQNLAKLLRELPTT